MLDKIRNFFIKKDFDNAKKFREIVKKLSYKDLFYIRQVINEELKRRRI